MKKCVSKNKINIWIKMKILLTGSNGFLAKNLTQRLIKYELTTISRTDFDLRDTTAVNSFFEDKYFDVVVHCAIKGGNRLIEDSKDIVYDNIKLTMNLMLNYRSFGKIIYFGSGAELDRSKDIFGNNIDIFQKLPDDPYGFSKNIIGRLLHNYDNSYNLRIFNVFANDEAERRMIKNNIMNYITDQPIVIHQDKYMDFIYVDDFIKIIELYIRDENLPKEIDCVYNTKFKLSDIANLINNLSDKKVPIEINSPGLGKSYCGYYENICDTLNFIGLEQSIRNVYESIL
jgi:nucleoside-diphosphate-sugar epimerase